MKLKTHFLARVLLAVLAASLAPAQTAQTGAPADVDANAARVLKEFQARAAF